MSSVPALPLRLIAMALGAVGIAIAVYLTTFFQIEREAIGLSADDLKFPTEWLAGNYSFRQLHQNNSPSWYSSTGLFLDTHTGRANFWTYVIGHLFFALAFFVFYRVARRGLGGAIALLFTGTLALWWFSGFNSDQVYAYTWRVPEAAVTLTVIGLCALALESYGRVPFWRTCALWAAVFLIGQAHVALFFAGFLLVALLVIGRMKHRLVFLGLMAFYVFWFTAVDGAFLDFSANNEFMTAVAKGKNVPLSDYVIAFVQLATQTTVYAFKPFLPENAATIETILRVLTWLLLVGLGGLALYRWLRRGDRIALAYLFVLAAHLLVIAMISKGRMGFIEVERLVISGRYASLSLVILFAAILYAATVLPRPSLKVGLLGAVLALGFANLPATFREIDRQIDYSNGILTTYYGNAAKQVAGIVPTEEQKKSWAGAIWYSLDAQRLADTGIFGSHLWQLAKSFERDPALYRDLVPCVGKPPELTPLWQGAIHIKLDPYLPHPAKKPLLYVIGPDGEPAGIGIPRRTREPEATAVDIILDDRIPAETLVLAERRDGQARPLCQAPFPERPAA